MFHTQSPVTVIINYNIEYLIEDDYIQY
jgi:hypothetical protein